MGANAGNSAIIQNQDLIRVFGRGYPLGHDEDSAIAHLFTEGAPQGCIGLEIKG